ncbi:MAG: YidC/Oxa1 family membrane protein insertase [Actinomycetota bacterium]
MQAQSPNRFARMIPILVIYMAATFLMMNFFGPKPAPEGAEALSVLEQAQKLDADGRKADPNVALADRVKMLEKAAAKYEEAAKANKDKPEGFQARFSQVNVYDYLAQLEGKKSGTHWYDQAEPKLKDMASALHGKTGEVKVEVQGKVETRQGDLGKLADDRLNEIRAERDVVNRSKWTYRILDVLVKLTGSNPAFSYAFALALVVVVLKVLTFPFQKKQYEYQKDMMRVQPLLKEMQEQMKGRPPEEAQRRQMQILKENNVNIAGGCLPMLVMMFVLFPVFWMVRDFEYQFTNATFLWIGSDFSKTVGWMGDNLAQFDVPLFLIYLLSTLAYSWMQPKPTDPQQAQQQKMMMYMMPVMFGVMMFMYRWSSAFMFYWLVLNLVSMYQSWVLGKQFGLHGGGGGGGAVVGEPAKPLETMKGMSPKPSKRRRSRNGAGGAPGRIRPKESERPS